MSEDQVRISVHCSGNSHCIFEDDDVAVQIEVTNISGEILNFPLAYARRSGVFVEIYDPRTERGTFQRRSIPRTDLLDDRTPIAVGGSVLIDWIITPGDLLAFEPPLDLEARFEVMVPLDDDSKARAKARLSIRSPPLE